jgi:hypothetical protein
MHALTPVSLFRILFTLLLIISFDTKAQTPYFESHAGAILKLVQKNHIAPKALNDSLSFQLYDQFIETIDPERLYFTKKTWPNSTHFAICSMMNLARTSGHSYKLLVPHLSRN